MKGNYNRMKQARIIIAHTLYQMEQRGVDMVSPQSKTHYFELLNKPCAVLVNREKDQPGRLSIWYNYDEQVRIALGNKANNPKNWRKFVGALVRAGYAILNQRGIYSETMCGFVQWTDPVFITPEASRQLARLCAGQRVYPNTIALSEIEVSNPKVLHRVI